MGAALRKLEPIEFEIRPGDAGDLPFITRAWAAGQRERVAPWCYQDGQQYAAQQNAKMHDALSGRTVLVAMLPGDVDARIGFVVGAGAGMTLAVDWIYVRDKFQERGIARGLLEELQKQTGVASPREVVGRGWSRDSAALVVALRRHGLAFRWAP